MRPSFDVLISYMCLGTFDSAVKNLAASNSMYSYRTQAHNKFENGIVKSRLFVLLDSCV